MNIKTKTTFGFRKAFSLIEISVVILIIGILIAGISQGIDMYNDFNLAKARNITKNSRVGRISNLELWLETTLEESFKTSERRDNSSISVWNDINIQSSQKRSASQSTLANQSKLIFQAFNKSIPAVRFDGGDYYPFDSAFMNGADFTIFVVEQRTSGSNNSFFIGGGSNGVFHLGYSGASLIRVGQYGTAGVNLFDYTIPTFSSTQITSRIHTFTLTSANGKKYWLNGGSTPEGSSVNNSLLSQYSGYIGVAEIGATTPLYYTGDIGEIIIYSKELSTKERNDVEDYLSKKYGIIIS
ncbi:MAG: prepilin-type N-terminal cleavage/methylation domain-containing protein [Proteobacteria bacterium]|nr:prepilin-type N-terminal cleavage/methylation domain-containing protein [Pseudomonadota bacterium]NCA28084.1 prepilin-type N-terminal cleavage/methylation domain-containing protein [Pseudomonadota bacterium]